MLFLIKLLLGVPLAVVTMAMLFHGAAFGWAWVSDFNSKIVRTIARAAFVLLYGFILFECVRRLGALFV